MPASPGNDTGGAPVVAVFTPPGQNARLCFNGAAGQRVSHTLSLHDALPISGSCNYVSVQNPDGTALISQQTVCGSSYFSDVLVLPATGAYTITVNPESGRAHA